MAASSGVVGGGLIQERFQRAVFTHRASGFRYRVSRDGGQYSVEFSKIGGNLKVRKELIYYVGSGATARSYVQADGGFLFESPVAYYSGVSKWDLAPGYGSYAYPYLSRPILPGCLSCHASFLNPIAGTQNRFATPPFAEGGVACERCHGPGESHIAKMKSGRVEGGAAIVNPAKLDAGRRDGICSQCHLSGEVRVMRPGADWRSFHPGDRLSDSLTVFVQAGGKRGVTVTGHVEKLAQSACQRASGERLWCGACHDPHALPAAPRRAAWFREKCLGCHAAAPCRETLRERAKKQDDCTACHMPKNPAVDAQHVVYTDHSIPRRPAVAARASQQSVELAPFGGGRASDRDLAMAYAIAAARPNHAAYRQTALALLQKVERQSPDDTEVLLYLAELYRNGGKGDEAIPLYRRAMRLDPTQLTASVGLGGVFMERGQYAEAIRLWEDALTKNSGLVLVRTNLAMAYWRSGNLAAAEAHLVKAVDMSPGFGAPAGLLAKLRQQGGGR